MPMKRLLPAIAAALLIATLALWWSFGTGRGAPYMVASANPHASEAGAQILKEGGSAVDAAIAVQAVLGLVEPESSGLAGGTFLLHWDAPSQKLDAYDGRETAPMGAAPSLFLDAQGKPLGILEAVASGRAVGTPGVVKMLWLAHQEHGKLDWARLFEPAIRLATEGFTVSPKLAAAIARDPVLASQPGAQDYFFTRDADGKRVPLAAGTKLRNPELAETLRLIAAKGPEGFYSGPVAQKIVDAVRHAPSLPGTLSMADLAAYEAKKRAPICRPYRAYRVCTMPPPTSGGIATLQILGILENFDMGEIEPMSLGRAFHRRGRKARLCGQGQISRRPRFRLHTRRGPSRCRLSARARAHDRPEPQHGPREAGRARRKAGGAARASTWPWTGHRQPFQHHRRRGPGRLHDKLDRGTFRQPLMAAGMMLIISLRISPFCRKITARRSPMRLRPASARSRRWTP